jgi:hypothetical protein
MDTLLGLEFFDELEQFVGYGLVNHVTVVVPHSDKLNTLAHGWPPFSRSTSALRRA